MLIVQCGINFVSRIAEYIPEQYDCSVLTSNVKIDGQDLPSDPTKNSTGIKKKTIEKLIFFETSNVHLLLKKLFEDKFLYRCIRRYFICTVSSPDLSALQTMITFNPEHTYRLQVFPKNRMSDIVQLIPADIAMSPTNFTHILSVVCANDQYYFGVDEAHYFFNSTHAIHSISGNQISRAFYKMEEIIERKLIPIDPSWSVVDVGASPGGWTSCLSPLVEKVVSIDPAELRIEIPANVQYLKMRAEDFVTQKNDKNPPMFDLLASDMNATPKHVLGVISTIFPLVKVGGYLIFTLKLQKRRETTTDIKAQIFAKKKLETLFPEWKIIRILWLLSNMNERTLIAQKIQ